jgi:glycosyltransferase involved in cell wall biosynthesis
VQLEETIQCFIDQDYENKELIVLNDQEGVTFKIEDCPTNIHIYNHSTRFTSLGEKRNYIKTLANGDYFCVWDDDDIYTPIRVSKSVELFEENKYVDIVKSKYAFMSINNKNYKVVTNLFHSQACISKEYMDKTQYPHKSVGEDMEFERGAKVESIDTEALLFYVYRWGGNSIHHLSGILDEKKSWDMAFTKASEDGLKGEIILNPHLEMNYWEDILLFWENKNIQYADMWEKEILRK